MEWLDDGVAAYDALLDSIQRAERAIRIQTYLIGDDETERRVVQALWARARDGLEVRVLLDDLLGYRAPTRS